MRHERMTLLLVGALLGLSGCGRDASAPTGDRVLIGSWNGPSLSLELDEGGGDTEYDCAHGGLSAPLVIDRDGRFVVAGVHVREHGGPARLGEVPDSAQAVYWGLADGDKLTLWVAVGTDTLGPFILRRDAPSQLVKCL